MSEILGEVLTKIINFTLGLVGLFIGTRIILQFFAANPAAPIVSWIYGVSGFFIAPFRGIFPNVQTGQGILDIVAIIALSGYILFAFLLTEVVEMLSKPQRLPKVVHYHSLRRDWFKRKKL